MKDVKDTTDVKDPKAADNKARRKALLAKIQSRPAPTGKFSDPAKLIREDRSR